jgi:hypothetical protein
MQKSVYLCTPQLRKISQASELNEGTEKEIFFLVFLGELKRVCIFAPR